jgi:cleavage and polyadenylation specificity factor subunit 4
MALSIDRGMDPAPLPQPDSDHVSPTRSIPRFDFAFSDFLMREYQFGLDPKRPMCKADSEGHCPLGAACPDKHQAVRATSTLVCKHWLRGLCKKAEGCDYLHEYNL